ncbi:hypothetical protein BC939DRAFT_461521 [Gamsiella multidivaricata]|uniref:uncharacterized protein n=1 Tax=Gamsiella multidivaricata TaxID=101098 RepID=UPI00221FE5A1|nr:uncharacterized protein BC939DRAFT_461521 [Gamsiella multidivaricata]KAI7818942.1 hypothetical protein BC939DRAFT_461521 [Gamsiella multidivaricata]
MRSLVEAVYIVCPGALCMFLPDELFAKVVLVEPGVDESEYSDGMFLMDAGRACETEGGMFAAGVISFIRKYSNSLSLKTRRDATFILGNGRRDATFIVGNGLVGI